MVFFKPKILLLCFIIFSYNSYAVNQCINNAIVTKLIIGAYKKNGCPSGECISFEYVEDGNKKSGHVHNSMNLDDEGKGMAMYDILKTALLTGLKIKAWSFSDNCGVGTLYIINDHDLDVTSLSVASLSNEIIVQSITLIN